MPSGSVKIASEYRPAGIAAVVIDRESRIADPAVRRIGTLTELLGLVERA